MLGFTKVQPNLRGLLPSNLLAEGIPTAISENWMQDLIAQAQSELNLDNGNTMMFTLDLPDVSSQNAPVMIAQADAVRTAHDRVLGLCDGIPASLAYQGIPYSLGTLGDAQQYFRLYEGQNIEIPPTTQVSIVTAPKHGKFIVKPAVSATGYPDYTYLPEVGYLGKDSVTLKVELGEKSVTLMYFFNIQNVSDDEADSLCNKTGAQWKVSYMPENAISLASADTQLSSWLNSTQLGRQFASGMELKVVDLPGTVIGQTIDSTITLDANAGSYNWFIDTTPSSNEEFLPTSNPNEWVAKPGSEAEGKMDLLSVLLHEYGHAIGIEHSADSHDFMAPTLQPGVRRLPSSEELALMAQLVNGLTPGQDNAPVSPSLPIGTTLGALLLGRLRRTDYGTWSPVFDSAQITTPAPQFDTAANPKLQNQEFDGGDGWATEGTVGFANGTATLAETAGSQTRLNQVFVLGEHDRFLSFTLANTALGDQAGPDDTFEVALLDANTGRSLLGGTGLSRNDAFLNLQANGKEYKASGIARLDNADGSRTYLVDLSGIAAGTTVNLAFDLIGFGQGLEAANSRLTIRDLRLGVPQATDDSATMAEDTPAVIDALANDLDARQPGFEPVVVAGPAHGQVMVNADGSFSFTPEADWYGEDHFTYKLSDGRVDSNIATVTLTVTPVNDAPVAADTAVAVEEDASVTIDLVALASDVDSGTFTPAIVNGPAHGSLSQNADGGFTYKPNADYNGADSFTYKATEIG